MIEDIDFDEFVIRQKEAEAKRAARTPEQVEADDINEAEWTKKIRAIKAYRNETGASLSEAKEFVEAQMSKQKN